MNKKISLDKVDAFFFDFDGVMTNNLVYLNSEGDEFVSCSRSDGMAFDALRKLKKISYILSTEKNSVVNARAKKLLVPVIHGVDNKVNALKSIVDNDGLDLKNIVYVGNDLNDFHVMSICGYAVCPSDSHNAIKEISDIVLEKAGGDGVVRELVEHVMGIDLIKILYSK
tara:strand:- start:284 stop:790 length:507 start_codon:yes stop_codon:yes gene_type:complete